MLRFKGRITRSDVIGALCTLGALLIILHLRYLDRNRTATASAPPNDVSTEDAPDVELVVASMKHENTAWLLEYFPTWRSSIYVVDDPEAALTVPMNKGRESMVYLTYIIDNYDHLPANILFIHAQRFQWHNDDPDYDGLPLLRTFRLPYLQQQGYVNLRCVWAIGCPLEIRPFAEEEEAAAKSEAENSNEQRTGDIYKKAFQELLPDLEVPQEVGVSCCAQFAVTRERIRQRPREEYVRYREWLLRSSLDDSLTGRVFEYSWHMIFGQDSVYCPSAGDCYCNVYGLCDLNCEKDDHCEGQYTLPPFATLPDGWPRIGWQGEERNFSGPL
ncbi:hypothetical protein VTN00DRAFT_9566 [Thermoascus crustaceus]|uniref:uncharacterized protein n=1 Tax=Thermoascus crustaceus TaxID=5088 RepID=UPI003742CEB4